MPVDDVSPQLLLVKDGTLIITSTSALVIVILAGLGQVTELSRMAGALLLGSAALGPFMLLGLSVWLGRLRNGDATESSALAVATLAAGQYTLFLVGMGLVLVAWLSS